MKAVILAAGRGSRMDVYTQDRPKCMVELNGRPLLFHQLEVLRKAGLNEIVLVTGYCSQKLENLGISTVHNPRYLETGMVYSLMCARELLDGKEDVLITYGDIVYEQRVIEKLQACPSPLCLSVNRQWQALWQARMEDPLEDAETLKMDASGKITQIGLKAKAYAEIEAQFMGLIKVRADFAGEFVKIYQEKNSETIDTTTFLQYLIDQGQVIQGVPTAGGWLEIDTQGDLDLYQAMANKGELGKFYKDSNG
jgi:choline kinase